VLLGYRKPDGKGDDSSLRTPCSSPENAPEFLYHGSPVKLDRLEPQPARGVGSEHDMLTAVYATDVRNMAIAFSMAGVHDAQGHLSWRLEMEGDQPHIVYEAGRPRNGEVGFVYLLSPEGFVQVAPHQWVSYRPVTPLSCEAIRVDDYLGWAQCSRSCK